MKAREDKDSIIRVLWANGQFPLPAALSPQLRKEFLSSHRSKRKAPAHFISPYIPRQIYVCGHVSDPPHPERTAELKTSSINPLSK
jgi:hypothetical protein